MLLAVLLTGLVGGASSAEASIPRQEAPGSLEQPVPLLEQLPLLEVPADESTDTVATGGESLPFFAPGPGPDGLFDAVRIPALKRFQAETRYRVIELEIEIRAELERLQTPEGAGLALFGGGETRRGSPNRYYDPELGRFISADPLGYVDGPSMYGFAGYSPMNFGDPMGLCFAGVTCREWLGEIFSGEGMKRSGRFLKGEVAGAGQAVKVTAQGAYQLVRHPIQTTQTVVESAVEGSASLVVNADRVPAQLAEAGRALRDASPEEQGKVTGEVLAGVLMGGAAGKGAKAVKSLVDFDDLADAGMVGFREGLEEAVDAMTPRIAVSRATASSLVPGGGLAAHEAAGGHLLARHVGQTEAQLSARLAAQPRIPAASTFLTRAEAEAGVSAVLDANVTHLSTWVSSGAQGQLVLRGSFSGGMVLQRGAATGSSGSEVVVVLRGTGGGAWRVHTGYPVP